MNELVEKIILKIKRNSEEVEIEIFQSGAMMIDFKFKKRCFCLQLSDDFYGLSEITAEEEFNSMPDLLFKDLVLLKQKIDNMFDII